MFSSQRRVAHFLMSANGAFSVTGTHTRRAVFRSSLAASSVFRRLRGLPSVNTTIMEFASFRPKESSDSAVINATEVRVLPLGQVRELIALRASAMFSVKCVTVLILQSV